MNGDGVTHHTGGDGVRKANADGANGPGMAKGVGCEGDFVAFELFGYLLADELEGGFTQVGVDFW